MSCSSRSTRCVGRFAPTMSGEFALSDDERLATPTEAQLERADRLVRGAFGVPEKEVALARLFRSLRGESAAAVAEVRGIIDATCHRHHPLLRAGTSLDDLSFGVLAF